MNVKKKNEAPGMREDKEAGRRIKGLRCSWTQAQFAAVLGVTQPMVSAWEAGRDLPSSDMWLKLGTYAAWPDCFWFWEKGGLSHGALMAAASKDIVARGAPPVEGEIIRIPRFRQTEQGREESGPPIPLPVGFLPNPAATICLDVGKEPSGVIDSPRGVFIIDTSVENPSDLDSLWDRVVLVDYRPQDFAANLWGQHEFGVYVGRLMMTDPNWGLPPGRSVGFVAWISKLAHHEPSPLPFEAVLAVGRFPLPIEALEGVSEGDEQRDRYRRELRSRAATELRLFEGIHIVGKVIGRLTGHLEKGGE